LHSGGRKKIARDEEESVQSMGLFKAKRKQHICNVAVRSVGYTTVAYAT